MLTPLPVSSRQLREFFAEAGFTHEQFQQNPALRNLPSSRLGNLPRLLESTAEPTALNVLLRWFFLGQPQEAGAVSELVPVQVITQLLETGMLVREGERFTPQVMLSPYAACLFAADLAHTLESDDSSGLVLWPNPSTRLLDRFTIRKPWGDTLDLGGGCGILAVLAASHCRRVAASDLNPRAAGFVEFNAWLNGVTNVEAFTGDTFEPVHDRTFDLIFCNPPFFISPSTDQMFCESNMELDGFCRKLVRSAPGYLNEGGYLQMTMEWVQVRGQAWQDRLAEWLKDSGCDTLVLHGYVRTAAAYASERIGAGMHYAQAAANRSFDEWMAYYRARGVEEVHGGVLAMRRRSGTNWVRVEEAPSMDSMGSFGDSIQEIFCNQDRLDADRSAAQMLAWKPRVPADAQIDQQLHLVAAEWKPSAMRIRRTLGIPTFQATDPQVMEFLRQCDGTRTLSELAENLAAAVEVNAEMVQQQCCAVIRRLAERRLILL